jgi:hypothetical protein
MRSSSARVVLAFAGAALLAGCGASSGRGTLTGGIRFVGRIPQGYTSTGYQRGLVQIVRGGKVVASAHLAQGQGYRSALSPGRYKIQTPGNTPPGSTYPPCTQGVKISAGRTVNTNVYCSFH